MEHACAKCSTPVEDGVAFCPQCRAPQIRVATLEPPDADHVEIPVAAEPSYRPVSGLELRRALPSLVRWPQALPAAALGGLASILALSLRFAAWGPAYALGGALAVLIYRSRARDTRLSPVIGAKIGAASGGFGFLVIAIVMSAMLAYHADELRQAITTAITQLSARGYDPEAIQQALTLLKSDAGLRSFVGFVLVILLVVFVAGSAVGGALCAAFLRRRTPH